MGVVSFAGKGKFKVKYGNKKANLTVGFPTKKQAKSFAKDIRKTGYKAKLLKK